MDSQSTNLPLNCRASEEMRALKTPGIYWKNGRTAKAVIATSVGGLIVAAIIVAGSSSSSASGLELALRIDRPVAERAIGAMAGRASGQQKQALSDLAVTLDEYKTAVQSTMTCIKDGLRDVPLPDGYGGKPGLTMTGPTVSPDKFSVSYSYEIDTSKMTLPDHLNNDGASVVSDLEAGCQESSQRVVESAYQIGRLADVGYVRTVTAQFERCAKGMGLSSLGATKEEVYSNLAQAAGKGERLVNCFSQTPAVASGLYVADQTMAAVDG